jgi:hypothetical protein
MSDETQPTTDRHRKPREGSIPTSVVASLVSAVLAGGGGSFATGWSVSGTMREGQLRLEARLDRLEETVRRATEASAAAVVRLETDGREREGRIRALELWRAQVEARASSPPR